MMRLCECRRICGRAFNKSPLKKRKSKKNEQSALYERIIFYFDHCSPSLMSIQSLRCADSFDSVRSSYLKHTHTHTNSRKADIWSEFWIFCAHRETNVIELKWVEMKRWCAAWELRKQESHIIKIKLLIDNTTQISWHLWERTQNEANTFQFS